MGRIYDNTISVDADGNATISGDLTVNGDTATLSTTNTVISDKLIELANGTSGTPSGDAGIIVERGSSTNAGLVWDESADTWVVCTTSATGASTGDLTLTDAALKAGSLDISGDTSTFASANSQDPLLIIKNTTNDANGARLRFVKDKGAAGAADDVCGLIEFMGDDAAQSQVLFGAIAASVKVATDGQEGGRITLDLASHDGELNTGLLLEDGDAEDEIDVTIGSGTSSLTTVAGNILGEGSVVLKEKAAAIADTVAYGQLWVKDEAPCELYFTTDAGDDIQLTDGTSAAGGGGGGATNDDSNLILHMQMFT